MKCEWPTYKCAGDGIEQDFYLAKRFFDLAADHDPTVRFPRAVAIFLLSTHQHLQNLFGADEIGRFARLIRPFTESFFALLRRTLTWLHAFDLIKKSSLILPTPKVMGQTVSLGGVLVECRLVISNRSKIFLCGNFVSDLILVIDIILDGT